MRRFLVGFVAIAAVATACSGGPEASPWAVEESTTTTTVVTADHGTATSPDPTGDPSPASGPGEIDDDECFDGEDRCGRILVPNQAGSLDRVALGFRLYAPDAPGVPLVFLESGFGDFAPDDDSFPGRPVLILGDRATWPGGPTITCPEWYGLDRDSAHDAAAVATARCAQRLADTGVTIEATMRDQQAADVIVALRALGIERLHLVAANIRADVVPAVMAELDVERHVLVEPSLAPADPVIRAIDRTIQSLEFAWAQCRSAPECEPLGPIDDFLDLVARLGDAPVVATDPLTDEPFEIDAASIVGAIHREVDRPETIGFLPSLHRALLDRDADVIAGFVTAGAGNGVRVEWLAQACSRTHATEADFDDVHPVLRADALDTLAFFAANCAEWHVGEELDAGHTPGLVLLTESTPDRDRLRTLGAPAVIEQTIGSPTHDCIVAAVTALLAGEPADVAVCTAPFTFVDRLALDLVPGEYVFEGGVVTLPVPGAWQDSGFGTWWREADPLDITNLDVYAFASGELEQTRNDFVAEWGVTDAVLTETTAGGRQWLLATGGDDFAVDADVRQVVATGRIDETVVVLVLQSTDADIDELVASVLEPALAAVEVN